ncbi:MAG: ABC transporter permease [Candidatus Diapherotrites archaeon]|nr:ABC transporter permease [Candidatus Diapherotrites archaeon]
MIVLAFYNLFRRKSRTILALIGLMIGVGAVVSLTSIVNGLYTEALDTIGQLQGVTVTQVGPTPLPFSRIDTAFASKLKSVTGVEKAIPMVVQIIGTIDDDKTTFAGPQSMSAYGTDLADLREAGIAAAAAKNIVKGQIIKPGSKLVMVSTTFAKDFKKTIGSSIKIQTTTYKIGGIFESQTDFFQNLIIMDIDEVRELFDFPRNKVSGYFVVPHNPADATHIGKIIDFQFEDELSAVSPTDAADRIGDVLGNLQLFALMISLISAVVAGIGVLNTMLMSVLERFKEIGVLKAVGWTDSDVIKMVLYETAMVGILGTVLGLLLGIGAASYLSATLGLLTTVDSGLLITASMFGIIISLISGVYPAYKASKLEPIEALRSVA